MESYIQRQNIASVAKQRNLFLGISLASILSCLLLSFKISTMEQTTILSPGINQEMTISSTGVSRSYLEEMSTMLLPLLLDLDFDSIDWKRETLLEYVSTSDPVLLRSSIKYLICLRILVAKNIELIRGSYKL
jgi:hypothetical protein